MLVLLLYVLYVVLWSAPEGGRVYEIIANLIKSAHNIRYANLFVVKKSILV